MANRPWYRTNSELYGEERRAIEARFPDLHFVEQGETVYVRGDIVLADNGNPLAKYEIEITVPRDSHRGLPEVRETGDRIPQEEDRHVNKNGTLCIVLPDAYYFEHPDGMRLVDFLSGPVQYFLANQALVDINPDWQWPSGQWDHGVDGVIQFYQERFGTSDIDVILGYLNVLRKARVKRHWACPCGSGQKLKHCHWNIIEELRKRIPQHVADEAYGRLREFVRKGCHKSLSKQ